MKWGFDSTFYKYMSELQSKKALGFKQDFIFLKTHSGLFEIDGSPFTNQQNTRGIIYILRDPRDVCISFKEFMKANFNESLNATKSLIHFSKIYKMCNIFLGIFSISRV